MGAVKVVEARKIMIKKTKRQKWRMLVGSPLAAPQDVLWHFDELMAEMEQEDSTSSRESSWTSFIMHAGLKNPTLSDFAQSIAQSFN